MSTCAFSNAFSNAFEICVAETAPVEQRGGSGNGWGFTGRPRFPKTVQLEGSIVIAVIGTGRMRITIDERVAADLRNVGTLMMLDETTLAEIAAANVRGHRAERVRASMALGNPFVTAATIEDALRQ